MNGLDKDLWDFLYNGKKFSIEALHLIEIKKRGKGPDKKHFDDYKNDTGPYYDPQNRHAHVWKKSSELLNFIGPQDQSCSYVQFTDIKEGIYCGICHCAKTTTTFNFNLPNHIDKKMKKNQAILIKAPKSRINIWIKLLPKLKYKLISSEEVFPWQKSKNEKQTELNPEYKTKWNKIIKKLEYASENEKLVYPVSKYKSLILWPWQLTPYQKFKISNPMYKDSCIFINLKKFEDDYAIIV